MWQGFPIKVHIVTIIGYIVIITIIIVIIVIQPGRCADGPNPAWLQRCFQLNDDQETRREVGQAEFAWGHGLVLQVSIVMIIMTIQMTEISFSLCEIRMGVCMTIRIWK